MSESKTQALVVPLPQIARGSASTEAERSLVVPEEMGRTPQKLDFFQIALDGVRVREGLEGALIVLKSGSNVESNTVFDFGKYSSYSQDMDTLKEILREKYPGLDQAKVVNLAALLRDVINVLPEMAEDIRRIIVSSADDCQESSSRHQAQSSQPTPSEKGLSPWSEQDASSDRLGVASASFRATAYRPKGDHTLPALPPGFAWPTETFSGSAESKRGGGGIVAYLDRVWLPLLEAGLAERRILEHLDPSAITSIENYKRPDASGKRKVLPERLHFPTLKEINDRIIAAAPDVARVAANRVRRGASVLG